MDHTAKRTSTSRNSLNDSESVELVRTELQNLDAEVSRVQVLLKSLVEKRAQIQRKLNTLASPMLKLPPEISSEIFTIYLQNAEADLPFFSSSPFLLGKICSGWREFVWSLPSLWSSVSINIRKIPPSSYATILDEYLSRSGTCPLSIHIRGLCIQTNAAEEAAMLDIIRTVARYSERWRHINFALCLSCYDALRPVQGRVPMLRNAALYLHGLASNYEPLEMFSIAPLLRAVKSVGTPPEPFNLILPSAQLTSVSMGMCSAGHCLRLLRASPRLINAEFVLSGIPSAGPVSHVTAPCAQSFTLSLGTARLPMSYLLDNLSFPAAHKLVLRARETLMVPFPWMSLLSLITRSGCVLQSLSLTGFVLGDDELAHCLQAIPSLTELNLRCPSPGLSDRFISMLNPLLSPTLVPGLGATPLLPNIQILKISGIVLLDCAGLCVMLSARWRHLPSGPDSDHPVARLRSATINGKDSVMTMHPPLIASLRQLVEEGMQISLIVGDSIWI